MDISGIDLLFLTLAVIGYATGAVLWMYFARPPRETAPPARSAGSTTVALPDSVAGYFDPTPGEPQAWPEAPSTR